jgi:hypothetical protein
MDKIPVELEDLNKTLFYDKEIIMFDTEEDLKQVLTKLKDASEEAITCFATVLTQLVPQVALLSNHALLNNYKQDIIDYIKKNPRLVMDHFVAEVYYNTKGEYRKHMVSKNEDFFLNQTFSDDQDVVKYIFQFKSFWGNLSQKNKDILMFYMITLCSYSDTRYLAVEKYKILRELHKDKYTQLVLDCNLYF